MRKATRFIVFIFIFVLMLPLLGVAGTSSNTRAATNPLVSVDGISTIDVADKSEFTFSYVNTNISGLNLTAASFCAKYDTTAFEFVSFESGDLTGAQLVYGGGQPTFFNEAVVEKSPGNILVTSVTDDVFTAESWIIKKLIFKLKSGAQPGNYQFGITLDLDAGGLNDENGALVPDTVYQTHNFNITGNVPTTAPLIYVDGISTLDITNTNTFTFSYVNTNISGLNLTAASFCAKYDTTAFEFVSFASGDLTGAQLVYGGGQPTFFNEAVVEKSPGNILVTSVTNDVFTAESWIIKKLTFKLKSDAQPGNYQFGINLDLDAGGLNDENGALVPDTVYQTHTVIVKDKEPEAKINSIKFQEMPTNILTINHDAGTITGTVPYTTNSVTLDTATAVSSEVLYNGTTNNVISINSATTTVNIKVTTNVGSIVKDYVLTITRTAAETINTIKDPVLKKSGGSSYSPTISGDKYTYKVPYADKDNLVFSADKNGLFSTMNILKGGTALTNGSTPNYQHILGVLTAKHGTSDSDTSQRTHTYAVEITSQSNSKKTYTIEIIIEPSTKSADLTGVTLNAGSFTKTFSSITATGSIGSVTVPYAINNGNGLGKIFVNLTRAAANSTWSINDTASATEVMLSNTGATVNTVTIKVTDADGYRTNTYTISVTRTAVETNNSLTSVTVKGTNNHTGTLSGDKYTVNVPFTDSLELKLNVVKAGVFSEIVIKKNGSSIGTASGLDIPIGNLLGTTVYTVEVTAQNGTVKTYTIDVVVAPPSTACELTSLKVNGVNATKGSGNNYTFTDLLFTSPNAFITTAMSALATMTIDSAAVSTKTITYTQDEKGEIVTNVTIIVTAQDGTTSKTYNLKITRPAAETVNTIDTSSINVSTKSPVGALVGAWGTGADSSVYTVTNPIAFDSRSNVQLKATKNGTYSKIVIKNGSTTLGSTSGAFVDLKTLVVGVNTIDIIVTSQANVAKTYQVKITVKNSPAPADLTKVTTSPSITLTQSGATYTGSCAYLVNSITLNIEVSANATYTVEGRDYAATGADKNLNLEEGLNTFTIIVTSGDGGASKTYTLKITRANGDKTTTLSSVTAKSGETSFSPTKVDATKTYEFNIPYANRENLELYVARTGASTLKIKKGDGAYSPYNSGAKYIVGNLPAGTTTYTVEVDPEHWDVQPVYYTINFIVANPNTDNSLTVTIAGVELTLSGDKWTANSEVPYATKTLTLTTVKHALATELITVNGVAQGTNKTITLKEGKNTVTILVTAQSGAQKTYTVEVTQTAGDTNDNINKDDFKIENASTVIDGIWGTGVDIDKYTANVVFSDKDLLKLTVNVLSSKATILSVAVNGVTKTASGGKYTLGTLNTGLNTVKIVVKPEKGANRTYTVAINVAQQPGDANINNLTTNPNISPSYNADTKTYSAQVSYGVDRATVTLNLSSGATATINGIAYTAGGYVANFTGTGSDNINIFTIIVTASIGGAQNTYYLKVEREAGDTDNTIGNIVIKNGVTPIGGAWNAGKDTYTVKDIAYSNKDNVSINVSPTSSKATYVVKNSSGVDIGASGEIMLGSLKAGKNTFTVVVASQTGVEKTYTVVVEVNENETFPAELTSLIISGVDLEKNGKEYSGTVGYEVEGVTLQALSSNNTKIEYKFNGVTSASNVISGLKEGENIIEIIVTNLANTASSNTYTLKLIRTAGDTNAAIDNVNIKVGNVTFPNTLNGMVYTVSGIPSARKDEVSANITLESTFASMKLFTSNGTLLGDGLSIDIPLGNLVAGRANTFKITVYPQKGSPVDYTLIIIIDAEPTPAELQDLLTTDPEVELSKEDKTYSGTVDYKTTQITLVPTLSEGASVKYKLNGGELVSADSADGRKTISGLIEGENTITIEVSSEGFSPNTYTLLLTREFGETINTINIGTFTIKNSTMPLVGSWSGDTYTLNGVHYRDRNKLFVNAKMTGEKSTMTIDGFNSESGVDFKLRSLGSGLNTILIVVTPEKGAAKTYTIKITVNEVSPPSIDIKTGLPNNVIKTNNDTPFVVSINLADNFKNIKGGSLEIKFDANIFEFLYGSKGGDWSNGSVDDINKNNGILVLNFTSSSGLTNEFALIYGLTFRLKSDAVVGNSQIGYGISNILDSDNNIVNCTLNTIMITVEMANNQAILSELNIDGISLSQSGNEWSGQVAFATDRVTVRYSISPGASIAFNGGGNIIDLSVGANSISIAVTSEDGSVTNNYTLVLQRLAGEENNSIAKMVVRNRYNGNIYIDSANINENVSYSGIPFAERQNIEITITLGGSFATMYASFRGESVEFRSGIAKSVNLEPNDNTIYVTVTNQVGISRRYTIVLAVKPGNSIATLDNITLQYEKNNADTNIRLSPGFEPTTAGYKAYIKPDATIIYISVRPTNNNPDELPTIWGIDPITDIYDGKRIEIKVISNDGLAENVYTILLLMSGDFEEKLDSITVKEDKSDGEEFKLSPVFDPSWYEYKVIIPYDKTVSTIAILATLPIELQSNNIVQISQKKIGVVKGETYNVVIQIFNIDGGSMQAGNKYVLNIIYQTNDVDIRKVEIAEAPNFVFNKDITEYSLDVGKDTFNLKFDIVTGSTTTHEVQRNENFQNGVNMVILKFTPSSGIPKYYIFTVNKEYKYDDFKLDGIIIDEVFEGYTFDAEKDNYSITVSNSTSKLSFSVDTNGTYEILGNDNLREGWNKVFVLVHTPSGIAKTYTYDVYREPAADSSNDNLVWYIIIGVLGLAVITLTTVMFIKKTKNSGVKVNKSNIKAKKHRSLRDEKDDIINSIIDMSEDDTGNDSNDD